MEKRRIGGLDVSVVGLGCNNFGTRLDETQSAAVIDAALEAGINFLDTADMYGTGASEEFIGRALGKNKRREQVILATKFGKSMGEGLRGAHPTYIRRAVEDSLRRLRTDRIDLYQQHEPDPSVPIVETLGALDELVRAGKIREIGSSNFSVAQIRAADDTSRTKQLARFVSVQNEYSLLERAPEGGVLAECERIGAGFLPFYPLASGMLTGKYRAGAPLPAGRLTRTGALLPAHEARLARVEPLREFAVEHGRSLLDLAFGYLLTQRVVSSVIAGASTPAQVRDNVAAGAAWRLSDDELAAVAAL